MIVALRLASGGWWKGDVGAVLSAPADEVMLALHYDTFKGEYESETMRLARSK